MKNEIAVVNENEKKAIMDVLGGSMVQDLEFSTLDAAIEKIGAHTGELSQDERESAAMLVDKFEDRVNKVIDNKTYVLGRFQRALRASSTGGYAAATYLVEYAPQLKIIFEQEKYEGLTASLEAVETSVTAVENFVNEEMPEKPFIDKDNMTGLQITGLLTQHKMRMAKFETKKSRLEYKAGKAFYEFKKLLDKNKAFKQFKMALTAQEKSTRNVQAIVAEKTMAAKMSLLISSEDIRKALREFHEFAKTLN